MILTCHGADVSAACPVETMIESPSDITNTSIQPKLDDECRNDLSTPKSDEEDEEDESSEEKGDDEDSEEIEEEQRVEDYPQLEGFIISEINNTWNLQSEEKSSPETFTNIYMGLNLDLAPNFNMGLDMSFEAGGDGWNSLKSPSAFVETLTVSYNGELGGISIGKYFLLKQIWDRQPGMFGHFISDDLDLSEAIGIRTWLNLDAFMDSDHYLYGGVFFRDTTPLSGSLASGNGQLLKTDSGVGNTEQFNNGVISLHGDELPFAPSWAYAIGFAYQSPGVDDSESESSFFSGLYGDFDITDDLESFPFTEWLIRSGADGEDQTAMTVLLGSSFQAGAWSFGSSYSHRYLQENSGSKNNFTDHNAQLFASYTFSSGVYIDFGYQFLKEDKVDSHGIRLAIGIPLDFTLNFASKRDHEGHEPDRNQIRRMIRR